MMRRGFTLIEMLLATVLSALLLGGVLTVVAAISKDAARASLPLPQSSQPIVQLVTWDLSNAATMQLAADGQSLTLIGNNALDPTTLSPSGRMARVVYRIHPQTHALTREQRYLDDGIRPEPWVELVAGDITRIEASTPENQGDSVAGEIPSHVTISFERKAGAITVEARPR